MASNKILSGSNKPLKGPSFFILSIVLITILIAFNKCEKPERVIQLTTLEALSADISFTSAQLKGEINDLGSAPIEDHGILISENPVPGISNAQKKSLGTLSSKGSFQVNADNLVINTTYYFRAFVSVNGKDVYADVIKQFKTKICNLATITTSAVSSVTSSSATTGGNVSADGGASVTARGVCWSNSLNPEIGANKTIDGAGTGTFTSSLLGLTEKTTYHVRAYATNAAGTAYGDDVLFITLGIPVITTSAITLITSTSAKSGGNITSNGGSAITVSGVCWNTLDNPTIDNPHTTDGSVSGSFSSNISGLTAGTIYHVRAYATNSVGTAYGADVTFTTSGKPTISTAVISSITGSSASSGGNITSDGGAAVTVSGVCWSTSTNPTTDNTHSTDGSLSGSFISNIFGLTAGTLYHVRAYATNSVGTAYGADIPFTTLNTPAVTTTAISSITSTSATSGGNVISDGGALVIARGVCWSTSANPTIGNTHTTDETGTGPFISNITNLVTGITYHVRAYATNSVGTAYGTDFLFTTLRIPAITTIDISSITPTTAISGGNITSDGGTAITSKGVCWNTTGSAMISDNKTTDGQGPGIFASNLTGLIQNTTYFVRAYATNSVGTAYGNEVSFLSDFLCGTSLVDHRDNKSYWTAKIGNQCWFAVNLNVGNIINSSSPQTDNGIIDKYCYADNESNCNIYGGLYQWDEMMQYTSIESSKGVCPVGWHIPSDNDWKILEMTLGMSKTTADLAGWRGTTEGGKLKATGTAYWDAPNEGATNSSLFTALPSGDFTSTGTFEGKGSFTDFWTSTFLIDVRCLYRYLDATHSQIYRVDGIKQFATSVRCVRDKLEK